MNTHKIGYREKLTTLFDFRTCSPIKGKSFNDKMSKKK